MDLDFLLGLFLDRLAEEQPENAKQSQFIEIPYYSVILFPNTRIEILILTNIQETFK